MKRNILLSIIILMLTLLATNANARHQQPDKKKSEVEKFIQSVTRIKSNEIDYAYISTNMFKQMFAMLSESIEGIDINKQFGSIKSVRRFQTTGDEGYKKLTTALSPFLQDDEQVMGMELMALNREDGIVSAIYSDKKSLLVINNDNEETLTVVFIVGLSYETFMQISSDGIDASELIF